MHEPSKQVRLLKRQVAVSGAGVGAGDQWVWSVSHTM